MIMNPFDPNMLKQQTHELSMINERWTQQLHQLSKAIKMQWLNNQQSDIQGSSNNVTDIPVEQFLTDEI